MSVDYFVLFKNEKPNKEHLKMMLEDYVSGAAKSISYSEEQEQGRWYVTLHGKPSFPFRRVEPLMAGRQEMLPDERWFEVYVASIDQEDAEGMGSNIDVITRMTDEYTNDVARGFAKLVARYYKADLDDGH